MRTSALLVLAAAAAGLPGCVPLNMKTEPAPLQVQAVQTRDFEVDKTLAMSSVISVFQDLGYIIQSADKDVGFITAQSPTRERATFLGMRMMIGDSVVSSTTRTRATAVLEELRPGFTTVRLNFVVGRRDATENGFLSENDEPVTEAEPYQVAFDKIENAIFVRRQARGATAPAPVPAAQAAVP